MNRRREIALQRVSRIGSLTAVESVPQNTKFKGRPAGALTIEAVIGTYKLNEKGISNIHFIQNTFSQVHIPILEESRPANDAGARIDFDRLDANRCPGFLLYSYNKKGVHSVLGEYVTHENLYTI